LISLTRRTAPPVSIRIQARLALRGRALAGRRPVGLAALRTGSFSMTINRTIMEQNLEAGGFASATARRPLLAAPSGG